MRPTSAPSGSFGLGRRRAVAEAPRLSVTPGARGQRSGRCGLVQEPVLAVLDVIRVDPRPGPAAEAEEPTASRMRSSQRRQGFLVSVRCRS